MATFRSDTYRGRYLELQIDERADSSLQFAILTWTLRSVGGTENFYDIAATLVQINGQTVYQKGATPWESQVFPAAKGSVSGEVRVYYNAQGRADDIPIVFDTRVYYGAARAYGGTMSLTPVYYQTPYVQIKLSNVTETSVLVDASSDTLVSKWEYTVDNGFSWFTLSTAEDTKVTARVNLLARDRGYNLQVRATGKSYGTTGYSNIEYFKTYGTATINRIDTLVVDDDQPYLTLNITSYGAIRHSLDIGLTGVHFDDIPCSAGTSDVSIPLTLEQKESLLEFLWESVGASTDFTLNAYNAEGVQVGNGHFKSGFITTTREKSSPSFAEFSYGDNSEPHVLDVLGDPFAFIKGYSSLHILVSEAFPKNGAKLASCKVTVGSQSRVFSIPDGESIFEFEYGAITDSGELKLSVEVIDTRGYSDVKEETITVVDYEDVSIDSYTLRRKNDIDSVVQFAISAKVSPVEYRGAARNGVTTAQWMYIKPDGEESPWFTLELPPTGSSFEFATLQLTDDDGNIIEFDPELQYVVIFNISDRLSTDFIDITLNKGIPLVAYREKKVGINEPNPAAALHVRGVGNVFQLNDLPIEQFILERVYPVGSIYISLNETHPSILLGGEWEQIEDKFLLGCGQYAVGDVGGEAEHTLTVEEMPSHAHNDGTNDKEGIYAQKGGDTSAVVYFDASAGARGTTRVGGDQPHNNMPPFLSVYMWKRIN